MRVTLSPRLLIAPLALAQGVVERGAATMLANVRLTVRRDSIIVGSNNKLGLESSIPLAEGVAEEGEVLVDAAALLASLKALRGGEPVTLSASTAGTRLALKQGSGVSHLNGEDARDFPPARMVQGSKHPSLTIAQSDLARGLTETAYAVPQGDQKLPTGILFERRATGLRLVAISGGRAALADLTCMTDQWVPAAGRASPVVPMKAVALIRRLLEAGDGVGDATIALDVARRLLSVVVGDHILTTPLLDAAFPDYESALAACRYPQRVSVHGDIRAVLHRASLLVGSGGSQPVRLQWRPDVLVVAADNLDLGTYEEPVACDYQGEAMTIGVTLRFLTDAIDLIPDGRVIFEFSDPLSAVRVGPVEPAPREAVMMPLASGE